SERINKLIHNSNGKINGFVIKYASPPMGDQRVFKLISEQHKKLQQQLCEVLTAEYATSAAGDVLASPKSWMRDTTQLFKSDLEGIETVGKRGRNQVRLTAFIFNILCKTATTKEDIIGHIRLEFNDNIQHMCVELDLQSTGVKRQLYIQITCILKSKINK
ncbi:unnamed protein product, partial [Rotaria socialis]